MTPRDDTITLRGRQVRLLRGGSDTPLLYLHDTFVIGDMWGAFHERLAAHYDVLPRYIRGVTVPTWAI